MRLPRRVSQSLLFVATCAAFCATAAVASVPPLLNYQGILLDGSGTPISAATSVQFKLWDAASSGNTLWSETRTVTPDTTGRFSVLLGSVTPIPDSAFAGDVYLGITVSTDPEMSPRQRIVSVGYAYRVGSVEGSSGGNITSDVSIGSSHSLTGSNSFVAGEENTVGGDWSTIAGGRLNEISDASEHFIGGGRSHLIDGGEQCVIAGGLGGTIHDNSASAVGGGAANRIDSGGYFNVIAGGYANRIYGSQFCVSINGGFLNRIGLSSSSKSRWAAAAGDTLSGATIAGGGENTVSANYATVAGGRGNSADGYASLALGSNAHALHPGSFVWADSSDTMASTGPDQFLIRATGGVGIGTDSPAEQLEVNGVIYSSTGGIRFPDNSVQTTAATGAASGWNDAGPVVELADPGDLVGIGTSTPQAKLDVDGDMVIGDRARIGLGTTNAGISAFAAGTNNHADGDMSVVSGGSDNSALGSNATVGGGIGNTANESFATIGGGFGNEASGNRSTIAGGYGNFATEFGSAVGGGTANRADGIKSTVSGGNGNFATGEAASIPGGTSNRASGMNSLAAGNLAYARHDGSIVLSAHQDAGNFDSVVSTTGSQLILRADSGFYMADTGGLADLGPGQFLSTSTGAFLSETGVWSNISDANVKENFREVDDAQVLERLASLPVTRWNYKRSGESELHIGPTAQDFREAFGLGTDDRHIATVDADGVALAAIKALYAENQSLKRQLDELSEMVRKLTTDRQ